jgi:diguanylate cyclase (GGDEF)-like protein/putative nucleotidyltransferase with HDIG domain
MNLQQAALIALLALLAGWVHWLARRKIDGARQRVQRSSDLHLSTIEALARAIDAKDQTAEFHLQRVQAYAAGLARAIGLPGNDVAAIKTAALLHDIGKLAIPEHILSKPGPLTPEEFQKVRRHSQVGADSLAGVEFPYPVTPLIRGHHERWDGHGYPAGLKGEEIPIGARILGIADYFDAVTTDRPYHKAHSYETGIALLKQEAGHGFDARLVDTFIDLLPRFMAEFAASRKSAAPDLTSRDAAAPGPQPAGSPHSVFEDIALANREIYALYEIAQSLGTSLGVTETMALISSKLATIVPWSSCALFLYNAADDSLACRYAAGSDTSLLLNRMLIGEVGPSGWVSRHRRTLIRTGPGEACRDAAPGTVVESALVCPLIANHQFIGTLGLYHVERDQYTDDHRRLLEQVAAQAAAVIQNSIVFEQTQVDSLTDSLTGLPNRRSLFDHLSRELARATRMQSEVALIVMDIDDFKAINDTHGHQIGDQALREVAVALHVLLRPYDLLVRYAGDEFVVVLSDCSRESAEAKRSELQQRVSEVRIQVRPDVELRVAASAGVCVFPHDAATYESLLTTADLRMYRDKAGRRGARADASTPDRPDFTEGESPLGARSDSTAHISRP